MAKISIACGLVLIGLGLGGYFGTGMTSWTALIPAYFGIAIALLGALALNDAYRMHAMHGAVLLGLIGFVAAGYRVVKVAIAGNIELPVAFALQLAMSLICAVFVALCVRSFIQARKARKSASN